MFLLRFYTASIFAKKLYVIALLKDIGIQNRKKYLYLFQDVLKSVSSMQPYLLPETELMGTNYTTKPASNRPIFSSRPGIGHIHLF